MVSGQLTKCVFHIICSYSLCFKIPEVETLSQGSVHPIHLWLKCCDPNDLFSIFDPLEKYWIVDLWGFCQMIAAIHERGSLSEVITWSIDERYHVSPSLLDPSLKDACGWNGSLYIDKKALHSRFLLPLPPKSSLKIVATFHWNKKL